MEKILQKTHFLSDVTKKMYADKIKVIKNNIFPNKSIHYVIKHPNEVTQKLVIYCDKNKLGDHTKNSFFAPIIAIFSYNSKYKESHAELYKTWENLHKQIYEPIDIKYKSNEPTEKQSKGYIMYDDVIKIRDELDKGSQERLLLYMYTEIPPVRSDYYRTKIFKTNTSSTLSFGGNSEYLMVNGVSGVNNIIPKIDNKTIKIKTITGSGYTKKVSKDMMLYEHLKDVDYGDRENILPINYIVLSDKKLVLQKYKTSGSYGTLVINLPDILINEINNVMNSRNNNDYLFISKQTGKYYKKEGTFNRWANRTLKKIFNNKYFNLTMLRHIYITRRDLKLETRSGLEQQSVAKLMGHSIEQQRKYLWHTWLKREGLYDS